MTTTRKLIRPGVTQITTDRYGRWYDWHGDRYWSVTTIIKGGTPNEALVNWAKKFTAEYAVDNFAKFDALMTPDDLGEIDRDGAVEWLKEASSRYARSRAQVGSLLHDYAEAYVLEAPKPEAVSEVADMLTQFAYWLDMWQPTFVMVEAPVFNRTEQYAGTLDAIVEIERSRIPDPALAVMTGQQTADLGLYSWRGVAGEDVVRLLVDYKTGKSVYHDTALQLAAYRHAEFVGLPDGTEQFMPEVDCAAALHVRADGIEFLPVDTSEDVWRSFLYVREVYRWGRDIAKGVIGAPMQPAEPPEPTLPLPFGPPPSGHDWEVE